MRMTAIALLMAATGLLGACEGSEMRRLLTADAGRDDADVADGNDAEADGNATEDTGEGDLEVTPVQPTLAFWFVGDEGPLGQGQDEVVLVLADEPSDYREYLGFQIDLAVETKLVAAVEDVRLVIDDVLVAQGQVVLDGSLGRVSFQGVTIPKSGVPAYVRVETVAMNGDRLEAQKQVALDIGACEITVALDASAAGCLELGAGLVAPPLTARVRVTRLAGACDRVTGTATVAGAEPIDLGEAVFTVDGTAELFGPVVPGLAAEVVVEVTALHPTDSERNGTASVTGRVDLAAPAITWQTPAADATALTLADDLDTDDTNGIQYEVKVDLAAGAGEAVALVLYLDEVRVAETAVTGSGPVSFGIVTFAEDGPVTLRVEAADGCDNRGSVSLALDVVARPDALVIVSPDDGAVLLALSDGDPSTDQIYETQFEVAATGAAVGTRIDILCESAAAPAPDAWTTVGTLTIEAVSQDGRYTVPVAADVREVGNASRCIARMDVQNATDSAPVRVTFAIPGPTLLVDLPVDGSCGNVSGITLAGTATGLDGRQLALSGFAPDGLIEVDPLATVGSGAATGDWSATYIAGDADGEYQLTVSGTDLYGNPVAASAAVVVDRAAPELTFTAPGTAIDGVAVPDEDPGTDGYQTTVEVAALELTAPLDGSVCLVVNGREAVCLPMDGTVSFPGVNISPGGNTLVLTGTDGCGNPAAPATLAVTLTLDNPIAITAPLSGATLFANGDGDLATETSYETTLTVAAAGATTGATLIAECRPAVGVFTTVGTRTITTLAADGVYVIDVAIDTVALGTSVECRARVDLPNPGASEVIDLVVALPAPTLAISTPSASACVTADIVVSGTASSLDGRTVTASLAGAASVSGTGTPLDNAWGATLALGTAPDGAYSLAASATDGFGNPASSGAPIALTLDRTKPTVGLTAPGADVTEADDVSTAAGVQVDVVTTFADARSGGQVCLAVGTAAAICKAVTTSPITFQAVTLQPGDNALTVTGTDACGNPATPVVKTTRLQLDAPVVSITTPAADLVTTATTIALVVTVTDADLVPLAGLDVTLLAGGVDTNLSAVEGTGGTYSFAAVPLPLGVATTFTAEVAQPSTANGVSGPRIITQKNTLPTITLTSPIEGAPLLVASPECAVGQTDCVLTATATTTNTEDNSTATVSVACGTSAPVLVTGTVTTNAVSFTGLVLTDGETCTLTPSVTDLAEQTATGTAVSVAVDRTPPTVVITSPDGLLQGASDDGNTTVPGMQHALTAQIGGVAAGATVTAVLSWNDGAPQSKTLTHEVTTTTPDGGSYAAAFEEVATPGLVTWPEGLVTLVVSVSDVSGNLGSATLPVSVDSSSSVRIIGPNLVPAEACGAGCAAGTVCQDAACWIAWGIGSSRQLVVVAAGLQTSANNVRVCSDSASLVGNTWCSSTASATGEYRQVVLTSAASGVVPLDLSASLPPAEQRLVVEILPIAGGAWISSQAASSSADRLRRVFVDLQAPEVTVPTSPSDDLPPTGTLNAAEQEAVPRAYDLRFTTTEAGHAELHVDSAIALQTDVPVGESTLRATLPEGTPHVWVVMRDAVGNSSPGTPGATYAPLVDVTPPTLLFTGPTKSPLKQGDFLDVVLKSNADGRVVTLFDSAQQVATGSVSGGGITFSGVLTEGSHTITASVSDAALNPTTAATTPAEVLVDTIPPVGTILSPSDLSQLGDADDANATIPGFQVSVSFSTDDNATTWSLSSAKGCSLLFEGCEAPVLEATGPITQPPPGGTEPSVLVTLDLDAAVTQQKIILEVTDIAGNVHTSEVRLQITVGCALSFRNLPTSGWFNASSCASPGSSCSTAGVTVEVGRAGLCGTIDHLTLYDGTTAIGTIQDPQALESFTFSVNDGAALSLECKAFSSTSEITSTGVVPIGVDLQLPQVAFISTTTPDGFVTPAADENVTWGFADDLDTNLAGMQFSATVRVTDANANGGAITALTATPGADTVPLSPSNGSIPLTLTGTSPIDQDLLRMTLADNAAHSVSVTARDKAGNEASSGFTATVDVTRPGVVTITSFTIDPRRPRFPISWKAVGDDGGVGLAAAYEVRYSTLPILTEDDWNLACDGNDSGLFGSDPMPPPATPGATMSMAISGPDARSFTDACKLDVRFDDGSPLSEVALYWVVRAFDEVGNRSALAAESEREVSNAELWNDVAIVRFDNSGGIFGSGPFITRRGNLIGDITGDGRAEWVVNSPNVNGFCVLAGLAVLPDDVTISTLNGPNHACLVGSGAGALFPGVTQTGHLVLALGDINGDGFGDFGVSGRISTGTNGGVGEAYVVVYLGRQGALPDLTQPNLRIRGIRSNGGGLEYVGFCSAGDFDGLVSNGKTTDDLAIGEPFDSAVHVIPGQASWTTASSLSFDLSVAGTLTTLGAWSVSTTGIWGVLPSGSPPSFGLRCAPAGDILATPTGLGSGAKDDVLVLQSGSNDARVFLFPGREFTAGTAVTVSEEPSGGTPEDGRSLRLRQELVGLVQGFGSSLQGEADFTGDGVVPDVLIGHVGRRTGTGRDGKAVYLFDGAKLQALVGTDVRVVITSGLVNLSYTGTNGWVVQASLNTATPYPLRLIGNFDRWTTGNPTPALPDLLIGDEAGKWDFLMLNQMGVGGVPFPVLDGALLNLYRLDLQGNPVSGSVGVWNDGGADLNGDGVSDIITGTNLGEVLIVH